VDEKGTDTEDLEKMNREAFVTGLKEMGNQTDLQTTFERAVQAVKMQRVAEIQTEETGKGTVIEEVSRTGSHSSYRNQMQGSQARLQEGSMVLSAAEEKGEDEPQSSSDLKDRLTVAKRRTTIKSKKIDEMVSKINRNRVSIEIKEPL
jgi:hypothetical protein